MVGRCGRSEVAVGDGRVEVRWGCHDDVKPRGRQICTTVGESGVTCDKQTRRLTAWAEVRMDEEFKDEVPCGKGMCINHSPESDRKILDSTPR